MTIVVLTAVIVDGAEDIADDLRQVLQKAADANWQGPGRLVTIRQHDQGGSGMRSDVIKAAAFEAVADVIRIADQATRDA